MSDGEAVQLYVYDLSRGLAKVFSPMLLDKTIEGVWHTSIVVGGTEYFYGHGINSATPGTTPCGTPVEVIELGRTHLDSSTRDALLADLSERSGRAGVEAEVEAELGSILAGGAGEEEAAALALQHEAQRLAGQQPLHGAGLLDGGS
ncbi:DESI1 [Auxenochlorella protothecoides x Auxenochlorella symbiontica]